jgi:hypothetical protein
MTVTSTGARDGQCVGSVKLCPQHQVSKAWSFIFTPCTHLRGVERRHGGVGGQSCRKLI